MKKLSLLLFILTVFTSTTFADLKTDNDFIYNSQNLTVNFEIANSKLVNEDSTENDTNNDDINEEKIDDELDSNDSSNEDSQVEKDEDEENIEPDENNKGKEEQPSDEELPEPEDNEDEQNSDDEPSDSKDGEGEQSSDEEPSESKDGEDEQSSDEEPSDSKDGGDEQSSDEDSPETENNEEEQSSDTETSEPNVDESSTSEDIEIEEEQKQEFRIIDTLNTKNAWSNKTVYLTFDDGPSPLTIKVLDLLKKENIKATFFLVGTNAENHKSIIKRISDEGHSIGNHSYSHDYKYIYKSVDNFFEDLYKNEEIIYEATGKRPKIIRFPGGSSNYSTKTAEGKKVLNGILSRLKNEGYVHFDWNASSGDASIEYVTVDDIINNTLSWISRHKTAVVLFHDTYGKTNTIKALPTIIEKLKFLGCNFEALTTSSPHIAFVKATENSIKTPVISTGQRSSSKFNMNLAN